MSKTTKELYFIGLEKLKQKREQVERGSVEWYKFTELIARAEALVACPDLFEFGIKYVEEKNANND